jgi:hypothetical protein
MPPPSSRTPERTIAHQVRVAFTERLAKSAPILVRDIGERLSTLLEQSTNGREQQDRQDAFLEFKKYRAAFAEALPAGWRSISEQPPAPPKAQTLGLGMELVDNDEVESKILWSRLALSITDKVTWDLNDLKLRIQHLEQTQELAGNDIFRPEVISRVLVDQWQKSKLTRTSWLLVVDIVQRLLIDVLAKAYKEANETLVSKGVMPQIDFKSMVRRTPGAGRPTGAGRLGADSASAPVSSGAPLTGGAPMGQAPGAHWAAYAPSGSGYGPGTGYATSGGYDPAGGYGPSGPSGPAGFSAPSGRGPRQGAARAADADQETRMLTANSPLARARMRAQGVVGQLKRLLVDRVADFDMTRPNKPSAALMQALMPRAVARQPAGASTGGLGSTGGGSVGDRYAGQAMDGGTQILDYSPAGVVRVAEDLREKTSELKKKANTQSEKATIEIVALMFQSILAEERLPPSIRVWFARLQMPVLRVALAEPEFFGTTQHPVRKLIDHMGSCVMGFDASSINGSALEAEIRRVVQVIEQYPETGRRVYQLVYDEFQKFLAKFLTEKGPAQKVVSVAQQVEQKEALSIKYTIELRNMLKDVPVRDEIREFLFKVWADVLAVSTVRQGAQHADTAALKKSATDLVWAASAKPNRNDRARVIQDLPALLQRLRQGMQLAGIVGNAQEAHIKTIGDTLADAFMSKTEAIPQAQIEQMAKRLANLEEFISDEGGEELPLDAETIEMMIGIDASNIDIISDGGSKPSEAMLAWAYELQQGTWFTLDHNGRVSQVQYAWRSQRKQLHLFASSDGRSALIQVRRLAAYLQAGLLVPQEEESLTVRATRNALAKLDANPERLLS